jgi:nitroimidazol reductase NimA-like FMN-containing flavoprotein (pyridoxamine 5'-phosphate oxidase superfamily)
LSVSECLALLATVSIGHLAVTQKALPVVVPVRIHLAGNEVEITSLLGTAIPLTAGSVVALQAGAIGEGLLSEWTVQVRGFLREISDDAVMHSWKGSAAIDGAFLLSTEEINGWSPISRDHHKHSSHKNSKIRLKGTLGS